MTINEAVALVLNATLEQYRASTGLRGCVSVLNMGHHKNRYTSKADDKISRLCT